MKIPLNNHRELVFEQDPEDKGNWYTQYLDTNLKLNIGFYQKIFNDDKNDDTIPIDQAALKFVVNKIIFEINEFRQKGENVLTAFHKEVFNNEFEEKKCYFDLRFIDITKIKRSSLVSDYIEYEFQLVYDIESKLDYLVDPYCEYIAKFYSVTPHHVILRSVARE